MAKSPGKCIFCQGGGLSKEHIIAEWVQSVVPKEGGGVTHRVSDWGYASGKPGGIHRFAARSPPRPYRQGDVLGIKLYRVCKPCNTGWMSRLQERAKPLLTPLLLGQLSDITPEEQETISAWITMLAMVLEFLDPEAVAIPQADRTAFMETKLPPKNWWIAIGSLPRVGRETMHTPATVWLGPRPVPFRAELKTQITTVAVGRLIFQAFSSSTFTLELPPATTFRLGLVRIWPPQGHTVRPVRTLNDSEAANIFVALRQIMAATFTG